MTNHKKYFNKKIEMARCRRDYGFAIFVAMVVMGTLLLIAAGVTGLAVRQTLISNTGRESQYAFYAADTGIECALYWDVQNPQGYSAFATSTIPIPNIECAGATISPTRVLSGNNGTTTFGITLSPENYCAVVSVGKTEAGRTIIESRGYNTCDSSNPRRLERAVRVSY